jgi:hypothetical protein
MIAVYVDDLAISMEEPDVFLEVLKVKYKFKLKGSGPISFHLGCGFNQDKNGVLAMSFLSQYIDCMAMEYERSYVRLQATYTSHITSSKDNHPETDTELLDEDGIQRYQSLQFHTSMRICYTV